MKIREGCKYICKNGNSIGPMIKSNDSYFIIYKYFAENINLRYSENGVYWEGYKGPHEILKPDLDDLATLAYYTAYPEEDFSN